MLITPQQVALHCDHLEARAVTDPQPGVRWTWIAGRRFRSVHRL